jgi:hypothetical protein
VKAPTRAVFAQKRSKTGRLVTTHGHLLVNTFSGDLKESVVAEVKIKMHI